MKRRPPPYYGVDARHYLWRAQQRLAESPPSSVFYASFELRAGIEARLRRYVQYREDLSKARKKGWRIVNLAADVEQVYADSSLAMQFAIVDAAGEVEGSLWFAPITPWLQRATEELNNLLHAQKGLRSQRDKWWREKRDFLITVSDRLEEACAGTLMGPPLQREGSDEMRLHAEVPNTPTGRVAMDKIKHAFENGERLMFRVSYHDHLPQDVIAAAREIAPK